MDAGQDKGFEKERHYSCTFDAAHQVFLPASVEPATLYIVAEDVGAMHVLAASAQTCSTIGACVMMFSPHLSKSLISCRHNRSRSTCFLSSTCELTIMRLFLSTTAQTDGFYAFPTAAWSSLQALRLLDGTSDFGLVLPSPWHWQQLAALTGLQRLLGVRMLAMPEEGVALRGVTQLSGMMVVSRGVLYQMGSPALYQVAAGYQVLYLVHE
jgi:hypothetical protein